MPDGLSLDPERLLEEKADWVREKLAEMRELRSRVPDRTFEAGESFPYFGEDRQVSVRPVETGRVTESRFELARNRVEAIGVQSALEELYRREARGFIESTVQRHAPDLGVSYGSIKVKNQKTLWGSCSSKKNLNFNWRIVMAPPAVAEYVVIHELCHLVHPNHSEAFWELLSEYSKDPREKARWLKDHAVELIFTRDDL